MFPCIPCCGFHVKHPETQYPTSRWMEELAKSSPEIKLRNLTLVSSHDAATSSIPKELCCSGISRTQTFSLFQQLMVGVRHLDTRYAPCRKRNQLDAFNVQHGPHSGGDYFETLNDVLAFVESHPREFIFLDCTFEAKAKVPLLNGHVEHLVKFLEKKFGQYAIQKSDLDKWFKVDQVTVKELVYSNKRILVMVDPALLEIKNEQGQFITAEELAAKGLFLNETIRHSQWHNTGCPKTLFKRNSEFMAAGDIDKTRLLINQLILTPQGKPKNLLKYLLCMDRLRVDQKQFLLFKKRRLQKHIRTLGANPDTNLIMLDFLDYDPFLLKFIIGLNLNHKLKVLKGSFQPKVAKKDQLPTDLTERLNMLIVRGNSLWILDLEKDLGVTVSGWINLSIEMDGEHVVLDRVEVNSTSQYLFNGLVFREKLSSATKSSVSVTLDNDKPSYDIDLDPVVMLTTQADENPLMPINASSCVVVS